MSRFRIKKCDGWNKYRVQKKRFLFWFNLDDIIYQSKGQAEYMCVIEAAL